MTSVGRKISTHGKLILYVATNLLRLSRSERSRRRRRTRRYPSSFEAQVGIEILGKHPRGSCREDRCHLASRGQRPWRTEISSIAYDATRMQFCILRHDGSSDGSVGTMLPQPRPCRCVQKINLRFNSHLIRTQDKAPCCFSPILGDGRLNEVWVVVHAQILAISSWYRIRTYHDFQMG